METNLSNIPANTELHQFKTLKAGDQAYMVPRTRSYASWVTVESVSKTGRITVSGGNVFGNDGVLRGSTLNYGQAVIWHAEHPQVQDLVIRDLRTDITQAIGEINDVARLHAVLQQLKTV